jgi:murein DD-endopeptidase MepM/ murein hydrolase activator NlpD
MNIIIVAKPFSTPKVLRLGDWRSCAKLGAGIAAALALVFSAGAAFGALVGAPQALQVEVAQAQSDLVKQAGQLAEVRRAVARDMDALALRLGRLQAEATRLNALGERLAKIGKLEDGEFDFTAEPAMGGPETPAAQRAMKAGDLTRAIDELERQLDRQSRQLGMLESVLLDRKLDQSLLPAGIPVRAGYVSSGYGYRADPFTGRSDFHPGVDFNGQRGADVLAVAGGVVSFAGSKPGYGNVVEIDHGNGYMTRYGHNDRNIVQAGDPVKAGEVISKMGRTGRATGVHVHFEVWLNGRLLNPSEYIHAIR